MCQRSLRRPQRKGPGTLQKRSDRSRRRAMGRSFAIHQMSGAAGPFVDRSAEAAFETAAANAAELRDTAVSLGEKRKVLCMV